MGVRFGAGEPVIAVGAMRAGKSNWFGWNLEGVRSAVVVDSKRHPDEYSKWGPAHGYLVTSDPADIRRRSLVVYQPSMHVLRDVQGWNKPGSLGHQWTQALDNIMARGNTVVLFDETVHQLPSGRPHPSAMQIYTQGAAYGLSPWAGTQFANRVETSTVRAAVHCVCFKLNPYDLKLLGEKRGIDAQCLRDLPKWGFGYHLTNTEQWQLCSPVDRVM